MSGLGGPVDMEPNTPAVYQLWSEAQGIIYMVNADMLLIFRFFCIKLDHVLSPFSGKFYFKEDLRSAVEELFPKNKKAPGKYDYICGSDINNGSNSHSTSDSGGDSDDDETKDDYGVESESYTKGELSSDRIQKMV